MMTIATDSQDAPEAGQGAELPGTIVSLRGRTILGDWRIADLTGGFPGAISVNLERDGDGATLHLAIMPTGSGKAYWVTPHGDVFYRRFTGIERDEAVELTGAFAELLQRGALPLALYFPHLVIEHDATDGAMAARHRFVDFLSSQRQNLLSGPPVGGDSQLAAPELRRTLYFDPPGIAEFLAPELTVDGAPVAGHILRAIYLPPVGRRQTADYSAYALEFESLLDDKLVRLELRHGPHERAVFGECAGLKVAVLGFEGDPESLPPHLASLCSWLLALLYMRAPGDLEIEVPASAEQLRSASWPPGLGGAARGEAETAAADLPSPAALNLVLDADCRQACVFCSVKSYVEPTDRGEAELESIRLQLQKARDAGVEEVRLNGIDPLAYSCVLDVVDAVRTMGFRRLAVFSPCRQLASAEFRRALLDRAPPEIEISIPLYGVSAEVHDAVTGLPGSHADALAAIDALMVLARPAAAASGDGLAGWWTRWRTRGDQRPRTSTGRSPLRLSTVIVKQNVDEFPALLRFANERGLCLDARVSYPMRQTVRDPYAESALRESEIARHFVDGTRDLAPAARLDAARVLGRAILHPCILFRVEQSGGPALFGSHDIGSMRTLHGTQYRSSEFVHSDDGTDDAFAVATVPCPHAAACALASACPGEHYAVYSDLFGLDEFAPVGVDELYEFAPADEVREFRSIRRT